jgi:hypothetical protein
MKYLITVAFQRTSKLRGGGGAYFINENITHKKCVNSVKILAIINEIFKIFVCPYTGIRIYLLDQNNLWQ